MTTKCLSQNSCGQKSGRIEQIGPIGKREIAICKSCCQGDLCNTGCNSTSAVSTSATTATTTGYSSSVKVSTGASSSSTTESTTETTHSLTTSFTETTPTTTASTTTTSRLIIRLVNGQNSNEGRVEVFYNGQWGTVCDDFWTDQNAAVVCRMLGYFNGGIAFVGAYFGQGSGVTWLDDVKCAGNENSIDKCIHKSWGSENCNHDEDAGVRCIISASSTPVTFGTSISPSQFNTASTFQVINTPLRIVNGNSASEGRVEVYHNGRWGTICDDDWGTTEATLVCKMAGYQYGKSYGNAYFGQGSGDILLDNVNCAGLETDISQCRHNGWGNTDCDHSEDAGVSCSGNVSSAVVTTSTTTVLPSTSVLSSRSHRFEDHADYSYMLMTLMNFASPYQVGITLVSLADAIVNTEYMDGLVAKTGKILLNSNYNHLKLNGSSTPFKIEKKGIYLYSTDTFSVFVQDQMSDDASGEGYYALPINKFGTSYRVITKFPEYYNADNDASIVGFVAADDDTVVNIVFNISGTITNSVTNVKYSTGDGISVRLNRLDTYQILGKSDLSGLKITSNKPIGVVSGNKCNPFGNGGCNFMVEFIPPIATWKKRFLIPSFESSGLFVKIVSSTGYALVNITKRNISFSVPQPIRLEGDIMNVTLDLSSQYEVVANEPILLAIYTYDNAGKAFMSLVPSVDQYTNEYIIAPPHNGFQYFVSILIETRFEDNLLVDNKGLVSIGAKRTVFRTSDDKRWTSIIASLTPSKHIIKHINPHVSFGVISYGFKYGQAFGFPGGFEL